MLPGKQLQKLFPHSPTASHCGINYAAYQLLYKQGLLPENFPSVHLMNTYEGLNGIDGLWLRGQHLASRSTFNPETNDGKGIEEVALQLHNLRLAWFKGDLNEIAQYAAYISHIVTDISTPPHQHGKLVTVQPQRWYLWTILNDWEDDYEQKHTLFEMKMFFRVPKNTVHYLPIHRGWLHEFDALNNDQQLEELQNFLKNHVNTIHEWQLFTSFLEQGWNKNIQATIHEQMLPLIHQAVATMWLLGTSFAPTTNNPLIRGES